jgi:hypothetical protein
LRYAYLDESGNTAPFQAQERILVLAVIAANPSVARKLALHVKRLKKKAGMGAGAELKANEATAKQRTKLLSDLAGEDVAIVAVVVDKRLVLKRPEDPEAWYREAAALVAWRCAQRWPDLRLILDRRYVKRALRERLEASIRAKLGILAEGVTMEHLDSKSTPGLQVADYVAWAIRRKYEGDLSGYDLIRVKIVSEDVIEAK